MIKKIIYTDKEARARLFLGAIKVSEIVGKTLGPAGRNAIIQKAYSAPEIVNDTGTIARHIVLNDPTEDLGAQTVIEATMKTNDRAGDARTTTGVLAGETIKVATKLIPEDDSDATLGNGASKTVGISLSILEARDKAIELLKSDKYSRKLKKGELAHVVATSIGKLYPEYVKPIAEMVEAVGVDGYIAVEDNWGTKYGVETTLIQGMRFLGSYISPVMMTNMQKECVLEDTHILVTNHRLENVSQVHALIEELKAKQINKLVIIAEAFEKEFIVQVASAYRRHAESLMKGQSSQIFRVIGVKAPSLTTDQFQDVAAFVDAKFFDKNLGDNDLAKVKFAHLGFAKKVIIDEDDTNITDGRGNVADRLKQLKADIEAEKDPAFKEQTKRRIGALTSGFGIIRVGAATESARIYVKNKINDAVNSAKGALEEGVVKGGGVALKEIAEEMGEDNILFPVLTAPYEIIKKTTGQSKVPAHVLDSLKSIRLAVENGIEVAALLITCDISIADKRETLWDALDQKLAPRDNEDFRDDENQELKYRT